MLITKLLTTWLEAPFVERQGVGVSFAPPTQSAAPNPKATDARSLGTTSLDRPVGAPGSYAEHARLMLDLKVLVMQADVTRVITFQLE